jgi:CRP-like cAMP-binding protein
LRLSANGTIRVLEVDPDLAAGLDPAHLEHARAQSRAVVLELDGPTWDPTAVRQAATPGWLGLLVVTGVMVRVVGVGSRTGAELFGPGDIIRPWDADGEYEPLAIDVQWRVLQPTRLAVLDARFAQRIGGWPTIISGLIARVATRARSLALGHAVSHLPRADARLLVLFWLLAERWGSVGPDGITVELPLTHATLAMLVGVRRPSVSLALQRLAAAGLLTRLGRDRWLLTRDAVDYLHEPESLDLLERGDADEAAPTIA